MWNRQRNRIARWRASAAVLLLLAAGFLAAPVLDDPFDHDGPDAPLTFSCAPLTIPDADSAELLRGEAPHVDPSTAARGDSGASDPHPHPASATHLLCRINC